MGTLRDFLIAGLPIDTYTVTPCPKLPARILVDDIRHVISLNIPDIDNNGKSIDHYTIVDYPYTHHICRWNK